MKNLFAEIPAELPEEWTEVLVETGSFRLERIVSAGQSSPPGEWCEQEWDEWVVLVRGSAGLRFDGDNRVVTLRPGDWVQIPAHRRHRVEWTDQTGRTVWLALHYDGSPAA